MSSLSLGVGQFLKDCDYILGGLRHDDRVKDGDVPKGWEDQSEQLSVDSRHSPRAVHKAHVLDDERVLGTFQVKPTDHFNQFVTIFRGENLF
jgi:hypothetical protein